MKPFFLLLLLIASGILFATLARPFSLIETALSLGHASKRSKTKRQNAPVTSLATGSGGNSRKPSLSGKRWYPASQF